MKILHISFRNLNSLAGTWSIDLTSPEYQADGIFAITGRTGAGKTTILDAVCLALYGRTPRLKQISKSTNEIMTRQTGECWAEVEFSTAKGKFRCHWSQHRARRSAEGDLQPQKHEIVDCSDDKVLATKIRMVEQKVIEVTGMDFDQFTRSILLAQGDFNTFLKANPDERSPILEQITGTDIYSKISRKVHDIRTNQQLILDQLRRECDGFLPLSDEAIKEINGELTELREKTRLTEKQLIENRKFMDWYQHQSSLRLKITTQMKQLEELQTQWTRSKPIREKLALAQKAEPLTYLFSRIEEENKLQECEAKELEAGKAKLGMLDEEITRCSKQFALTEETFLSCKQSQKKKSDTLRQVRELDQQLTYLLQQKKESEGELEKESSQIEKLTTSIVNKGKEITEQQAVTQKLRYYQHTSSQDAALTEELSGIRQQIRKYVDLTNEKDQSDKRREERKKELIRQQEQLAEQRKEIESLRRQIQEWTEKETSTGKQLNRLLAGEKIEDLYLQEQHIQELIYRLDRATELHKNLQTDKQKIGELQKESAELANKIASLNQSIELETNEVNRQKEAVAKQEKITLLAAKVKNLEQERLQLRQGQPCPLCGSPNHPFSRTDQTPEESEEQIRLVNERQKLQQCQDKLSQQHTDLASGKTQYNHVEKESAGLRERIAVSTEKLSELCVQLEIPFNEQQIDEHLHLLTGKLTKDKAQLYLTRKKSEELTALQKSCDAKRDVLVTRLNEALLELQKGINLQDRLSEQEDELRKQTEKQQRELTQLETDLRQQLKPYTSLLFDSENHREIITQLETKRSAWQQSVEQLQSASTALVRLESEKKQQEETRKQLGSRRDHLQKSLHSIAASFATTHQSRYQLLGDQDPNQVEQQMQKEIEELEKKRERLRSTHRKLEKEHAVLKERAEALDKRITSRIATLHQKNGEFRLKLNEAGFTNLQHFLDCRIDSREMVSLVEQVQELQKSIDQTAAILKANREALIEEETKKLTDLAPEEIKRLIEELDGQLSELQQQTGGLNQKLLDDSNKQKRYEDKLNQIQNQQKEVERWSRLHELIGSSDGKKFRNFAQGLTFEIVINHANISLRKMTDRYLLVRDEKEPLELLVIDNYQAGEERSTKNLSGGESFIVSMALALGLSSMASNNVQVDSLFLDEGFGTLDEDALQTALDTLGSLHQEGKIIGIISHVRALQERIATRIRVLQGPGGLSTLSGPGTEKIGLR